MQDLSAKLYGEAEIKDDVNAVREETTDKENYGSIVIEDYQDDQTPAADPEEHKPEPV